MVAANLVSKYKNLDEDNTFTVDSDLKLLKSAAIYGANASGKSNLAEALTFMRWFMVNSSKETQSTDEIGVENFKLSTETEAAPSFFEIVFLLNQQKFKYGFEATVDRVVSEWLFYVPKTRETPLFKRSLEKIISSKKYGADGIQQRTRRNALFLSVSAQFNVEIAEEILDWATDQLKVVSGLDDRGYKGYTVDCLVKNENRKEILQLLKKLDLGISQVEVEQSELTADFFPDDMPDELRKMIIKGSGGKVTSIQTVHQKFDEKGNYVSDELFSLESQESEGTQKVFALAGPLVDALNYGKAVVIDEFDARFHPLISCAIVSLFNSSVSNPNNAQLIFMTHDTNLLSNRIFRKDQIWFTEKDRYGATTLYSLVEYKGVRSDASYENDYIKGRYGAIPYIGSLSHIIESNA